MTCVEGQEFDDMCKVLPIGWFLVHELSKHSISVLECVQQVNALLVCR